jgi:hypothetical protein
MSDQSSTAAVPPRETPKKNKALRALFYVLFGAAIGGMAGGSDAVGLRQMITEATHWALVWAGLGAVIGLIGGAVADKGGVLARLKSGLIGLLLGATIGLIFGGLGSGIVELTEWEASGTGWLRGAVIGGVTFAFIWMIWGRD